MIVFASVTAAFTGKLLPGMPAALATRIAPPSAYAAIVGRRRDDDRLRARADEGLRCADVRVARAHVHSTKFGVPKHSAWTPAPITL